MLLNNKKKFFTKSYKIENLLDGDWQERVRVIESFSNDITTIPKIRFDQKNNELTYIQEFIKNDNTKFDLEPIAETLDYFEKIDFVHGDINRKNILSHNCNGYIVDFEPSLKQIKNRRTTLLFTMPYVSPDDFQNSILTIQSDKVGFYFYLKGIKNKVDSKHIVMLKNKILNREHA